MPTVSTTPAAADLERLMPGVTGPVLAALAARSRRIVYQPGEMVGSDDEPGVPCVVVEGSIRAAVRAADGREATIRMVSAGDMLGLVALFGAPRAGPWIERVAVAVGTTTVIAFDPPALLQEASQSAAVAMFIARQLAESASLLGDTAGLLAFMTVRQRLAIHLIGLARQSPAGSSAVRVTHQQLADGIGSVREVVTRALDGLRRDGLIAVGPGRIEILDASRLTSAALGVT